MREMASFVLRVLVGLPKVMTASYVADAIHVTVCTEGLVEQGDGVVVEDGNEEPDLIKLLLIDEEMAKLSVCVVPEVTVTVAGTAVVVTTCVTGGSVLTTVCTMVTSSSSGSRGTTEYLRCEGRGCAATETANAAMARQGREARMSASQGPGFERLE